MNQERQYFHVGEHVFKNTAERRESEREREGHTDVERGIIAGLDAINLYEQMAVMTGNAGSGNVLLDIAREEKTHGGEFQALFLMLDREQQKELEHGKEG